MGHGATRHGIKIAKPGYVPTQFGGYCVKGIVAPWPALWDGVVYGMPGSGMKAWDGEVMSAGVSEGMEQAYP
ncbi:MAG: hypothetical protein ABI675_19985 [Chitinophagaceae bacterium]